MASHMTVRSAGRRRDGGSCDNNYCTPTVQQLQMGFLVVFSFITTPQPPGPLAPPLLYETAASEAEDSQLNIGSKSVECCCSSAAALP
jgi:hypothetical protein